MSTVRALVTGILALLLASQAGCAAARASLQINQATQSLAAAESEGAAENAQYEYTMASSYLEKAWEEMGTSQYGISVDLAQKSMEWADQAIIASEAGARSIDVDLSGLTDEPIVPDPDPVPPMPAAPAPAPAPAAPATPAPATPAPATPAAPVPAAPVVPDAPTPVVPATPPNDPPGDPVPVAPKELP